MKHDVFFTDRAASDFDQTVAYYATRDEALALRWCRAVEEAIACLETDPDRFALAREHDRVGLSVRQINLGVGRRLTHRLVYAVRPSRVVVYTIRHLVQADLTVDDLD